jgi:hypothetical protein
MIRRGKHRVENIEITCALFRSLPAIWRLPKRRLPCGHFLLGQCSNGCLAVNYQNARRDGTERIQLFVAACWLKNRRQNE